MNTNTFMGEMKIPKLLFEFSLPAIAGLIFNALFNLVDRFFVGNAPDLGANGLAAVTITFPINLVLLAVSLMCGVGGAALFAIHLGENKPEKALKILGNTFSVAIFMALIVEILFLIFLRPTLELFGAHGVILDMSSEYLAITLLGSVFLGINLAGNNMIRANGSPKIAMLTIIFSCLVNTILNPIFIYIFKWGMAGCGLATIIAQAVASIWIIYYFTLGKSNNKLTLKNMRIDPRIAFKIILTGLPAFFIQSAASILNMVINFSLVSYGGDVAISAMGIVNSIQLLLLMPMMGINQASLPIISYNYGADKIDRVRETVKLSIIISTIIGVIGWLIVFFFARNIIQVFNNDPAFIDLGEKMLRIWFIALPVIGVGMVGSNYFQALGKVFAAIFLTLSRQIIILIPLIYILSSYFQLNGILYAAPISDVLSSIMIIIMLSISMSKLKKTREKNKDKEFSALS